MQATALKRSRMTFLQIATCRMKRLSKRCNRQSLAMCGNRSLPNLPICRSRHGAKSLRPECRKLRGGFICFTGAGAGWHSDQFMIVCTRWSMVIPEIARRFVGAIVWSARLSFQSSGGYVVWRGAALSPRWRGSTNEFIAIDCERNRL